MDATEIERVVAESVPTPPRTRLARGSNQIEITPPPELWLPADDAIDAAALLLPFRARRPWLAIALTMALAAGLILALHHIISAG